MNWQIALALSLVLATTQSLFQRSYSQKNGLPESFPPALSYLFGLMPISIVVGLVLRHHVQWSWWLVLLLASEGTFIGLYNWLQFRAMRRLPVARFQLIYQLYELVVIVLGWVFLREGLSVPEIVGGILILSGALLAIRAPVDNKQQLKHSAHAAAIALAVAAALVMGIGLVIEKAALRHMDMGAYFIFGFGTQSLALLVLAARDVTPKAIRNIRRRDWAKSITMGVLSAIVGFTYVAAIVGANNISLVTALSAFGLPLTILGGYVVLRERDNLKLLLSALGLGLTGLIISALR